MSIYDRTRYVGKKPQVRGPLPILKPEFKTPLSCRARKENGELENKILNFSQSFKFR